jgi:hypothetical protein
MENKNKTDIRTISGILIINIGTKMIEKQYKNSIKKKNALISANDSTAQESSIATVQCGNYLS